MSSNHIKINPVFLKVGKFQPCSLIYSPPNKKRKKNHFTMCHKSQPSSLNLATSIIDVKKTIIIAYIYKCRYFISFRISSLSFLIFFDSPVFPQFVLSLLPSHTLVGTHSTTHLFLVQLSFYSSFYYYQFTST